MVVRIYARYGSQSHHSRRGVIMKKFIFITFTILFIPLWLIGFIAQTAYAVIASGWLESEAAMLKMYRDKKQKEQKQ